MNTDPLRGFFSILSTNVGRLFLGIAITPILVRVLGSAAYGDYAFVLSILGIAMILVNAGITDGIRKFVAEDRDIEGWANAVYAFYVHVATLLAITAAFAFIVANLTGLTAWLLDARFVPYMYLLAALVVARQAFSIVRSSLMGKGLEHRSEPLRVGEKFLFGAFGISLAAIGYDVSGVLAGHLIAVILMVLIGAVLLSRHYDLTAPLRRPDTTLPRRDLLSFNLNSVILILLTASLYHTDILLLQPLVGSDATGLYKAALVVVEFTWFVPFALQLVLLHSASELWATEQTDRVSTIAARITRYTLFFTLLLALGIAALAEPFVGLYFGPDFTAAVLPLWLLLPGALGFAIARPIFAIGQGSGTMRPLIVATGAAAVLNLGLNLLLIPRYGMAGAAVATSVGYGSMLGFHTLAARAIGYTPAADLRLLRIGVTAIVSGIMIAALALATGPGLASLFIVPPVGFVVYTIIGLRVRAVDPAELLQLLEPVPNPLSRHVGALIEWLR